MDFPTSLLFICPMVLLAGFIDAVAGGGGIITLPVFMLTGLPAHQAYGCNKFSAAAGTTFSAARFLANKVLDLKVAVISAISAFIGAAVASRIVLYLPGELLKKMMIIILPIVAVVIFIKKDYGNENQSASLGKNKMIIFAILIGILIGLYDGIFGPGTGTFAIIAYTMIMKYDLKTASGNAKILNLASNYASVVTYMIAGTVVYNIAIPAAICGIIGNYLGAGFAIKRGAKFIKPMMMVVVVLILGKMFVDVFM